MVKWVIMHAKEVDELKDINELSDIFETNIDGSLMIFDTFDDACDYQEQYLIDGKVTEIPIY